MKNTIEVFKKTRTAAQQKLISRFLNEPNPQVIFWESSIENSDIKIWDNSEWVFFSLKKSSDAKIALQKKDGVEYYSSLKDGLFSKISIA